MYLRTEWLVRAGLRAVCIQNSTQIRHESVWYGKNLKKKKRTTNRHGGIERSRPQTANTSRT